VVVVQRGLCKMNRIIEKLTSGRFLVTLMLACTYCFLSVFMVTKLSDKITGDFVLGFLGGFSTSFMLILQWYFDKDNAKETVNDKSNPIVSQ
jgi:hypothetical protein